MTYNMHDTCGFSWVCIDYSETVTYLDKREGTEEKDQGKKKNRN